MPPTQAPDAHTTEQGAPERNLRTGVLSGPFGDSWRAIIPERELQIDLRWPRSIKTYASMLNDAQVDGLYRGATLPIRAYDWRIDPNGARAEVVQAAQADFGLDLVGQDPQPRPRTQQRFIFDEHLEDALRMVSYGHYFFEQVYRVLQDGPAGINGGWFAHLRKLGARPPVTISAIIPAPDGALQGIKVPALNRTDPSQVGQDVELSVDQLVAYVWDREGANWRGRSMLRSLYRPWKVKDRVMKVGAINIERAGGVPYATAPEGATQKQIDTTNQLVTQFRVGESSGATFPHGTELKFAQAAGGDQAIAYVRLQNEEMARAWLMMFMQIGETSSGRGSTQQAEQQIDYFGEVQDTIAGAVAKVFSRHVIEDWVELNFGSDERFAPLLTFERRGSSVTALADELDDAQVAGALPANSYVASTIRAQAGDVPRQSRRASGRVQAATEVDDGEEFPLSREPTEDEQHVDFQAIGTAWLAARTALVDRWRPVRRAQIAQLVAQVRDAGTLSDLLALEADTAGADRIGRAATDMAQFGIDQAVAEATAQGVAITAPSIDGIADEIQGRAAAVAETTSRALAESAAREATRNFGGVLTPDDVADLVDEHLSALTDAFLEEQFGGVLTGALNQGRFLGFEEYPTGTRFLASEVLDTNTCDPCRTLDGTEFTDLDAARRMYPVAGYTECEGRLRCRGTLVAVAPSETPASVA